MKTLCQAPIRPTTARFTITLREQMAGQPHWVFNPSPCVLRVCV